VDVKIVNVYNDSVLPNKGLKGSWRNAFHVTMGEREVLFDVGYKGGVLLRNIHALGIDVDKIEKLILSHGHRDHTGGLVSFLKARTIRKPLPIIGHPGVSEPKSVKILIFHLPEGLPKLSQGLLKDVSFQLTKNPAEVLPGLSTSGEIPTAERPEKLGIASRAFHKVDGRREWDPVMDDLSLIVQAKEGLVIVTGCCHAGLLNTCARATKLFSKKIKAIIGGTHMIEYSKDDVKHVGDVLENTYGTPELYLNHCTGKEVIQQLRTRFGSAMVHDCFAGSELTFKT
jgi:7,8-dihydropterin-6-yl-methyl-4-(beta-D-ribofuranosyl)aminobenzene 5'-phosphate synthase